MLDVSFSLSSSSISGYAFSQKLVINFRFFLHFPVVNFKLRRCLTFCRTPVTIWRCVAIDRNASVARRIQPIYSLRTAGVLSTSDHRAIDDVPPSFWTDRRSERPTHLPV